MGAAIATLLAYIFLALATYGVNQRIYPVPFDMLRFLLLLALGTACYLGSCWLAEQTPELLVRWGIQLGMLILYAGCLVAPVLFERRRERKLSSQAWEVLPL